MAPLRFEANAEIYVLLEIISSWMIVGFVAVTFRFTYVMIQEAVNFLTHGINHTHRH
jgi:hypothetical protein